MAENLTLAEGDDGNTWIWSILNGTGVAIVYQRDGGWFAAEYERGQDEVGPFKSLDALLDHVEEHKLFGPWFGLGN
jgi:hypothetical protein